MSKPTVVVRHFTNRAFGFPTRGHLRRIKPTLIACIHITGNFRVASNPNLHAAALAEWTYANRAASPGPSATHYTSRDLAGWLLEAVDWRRFAAWSNGDVSRPDLRNKRIAAAVAARSRGYNLNEFFGGEFENVGGGTLRVLLQQLDADAYVCAQIAKQFGLPISRETIVGHWQINGVDRQNCPCPAAMHEQVMGYVVTRTKAWYAVLYPVAPKPVPAPVPAPQPEEYPVIVATDSIARQVTVRLGSTLFDLNGKSLVRASNQVARLSPGSVAGGRFVFTTFDGSTKLAIAHTADIVGEQVIPSAATALIELGVLGARVKTLEERLGEIRDLAVA